MTDVHIQPSDLRKRPDNDFLLGMIFPMNTNRRTAATRAADQTARFLDEMGCIGAE
jgi:hypothetical protein